MKIAIIDRFVHPTWHDHIRLVIRIEGFASLESVIQTGAENEPKVVNNLINSYYQCLPLFLGLDARLTSGINLKEDGFYLSTPSNTSYIRPINNKFRFGTVGGSRFSYTEDYSPEEAAEIINRDFLLESSDIDAIYRDLSVKVFSRH